MRLYACHCGRIELAILKLKHNIKMGSLCLTMSSGSSGQRVTVPEPLSSTLFLIKRMLPIMGVGQRSNVEKPLSSLIKVVENRIQLNNSDGANG